MSIPLDDPPEVGQVGRSWPQRVWGLITSFIMELLIYPVIFYFHNRWEVRRRMQAEQQAAEVGTA